MKDCFCNLFFVLKISKQTYFSFFYIEKQIHCVIFVFLFKKGESMTLKDKLDILYQKQLSEIDSLKELSIRIITVGDDIASQVYVKNKVKLLTNLECNVNHLKLDESISQKELEDIINIESVNYTGILVQLPLPAHLNEPQIPVHQDVDGFHKDNEKVLPCTVQACLDIMNDVYGNIKGTNIAVLGRSNIVGLPLVIECIKKSATVTSMNSHTKMIQDWSNFDIVISATGHRFLTDDDLKNVSLVIDVGIHRIDGNLCGDIIHLEGTNTTHETITPVPFGVGRFTVLNVARNLKRLSTSST